MSSRKAIIFLPLNLCTQLFLPLQLNNLCLSRSLPYPCLGDIRPHTVNGSAVPSFGQVVSAALPSPSSQLSLPSVTFCPGFPLREPCGCWAVSKNPMSGFSFGMLPRKSNCPASITLVSALRLLGLVLPLTQKGWRTQLQKGSPTMEHQADPAL